MRILTPKEKELLLNNKDEFSDIHPDTVPSRPFIHKRFLEMAAKAGIDNPILCVGKGLQPNMCAVSHNIVIVSDSMLNLLDDREIVAFLAHELGHMRKWKLNGLLSGVGEDGIIVGTTAGIVLAHKLAGSGPDKKKFTRRNFLKSGVLIGTAAVSGKMGYEFGREVSIPIREHMADDAVVELSEDRDAFISAMLKLKEWEKQNNLLTGTFYPSWDERISRQLPASPDIAKR
jgi:hypothetical protein